jgi:hydroxypyruvate isomerase
MASRSLKGRTSSFAWIGSGSRATLTSAAAPQAKPIVQKARLKQSVCRWCYQKIPLFEFCKAVAEMGLTAVNLVDEKDWGVLADHGLHCSMAWNTSQ